MPPKKVDWNRELLYAASSGDQTKIIKCLENGAQINYTDYGGLTALHHAAQWGNLETCRFLLQAKVNPKVLTRLGWTTLHFAAFGGHHEICRLLLDAKVNPLKKTELGETALYLAVERGHLQTCQLLLDVGKGDLMEMKVEGKTPYDVARRKGNWDVLNLLMKYMPPGIDTPEALLQLQDQIEETAVIQDPVQSAMLNRLLGQGYYQCFDMRVMVTGQFGVGKTTLVKILVGDEVPEDRLSTDGISLLEGRCGLEIDNKNWIIMDRNEYDALDVVYNKVMMTSEKDTVNQTSESIIEEIRSRSTVPTDKTPLQSEISLNQHNAPVVGEKSETKTYDNLDAIGNQYWREKRLKSRMTKKEIRKKMTKVLKSGKYKMKIGRLIFWDFGGQYVYYTTHQTFMTYRAIFLIVFDGSKDLFEEISDVLCFPGQHGVPTQAVFLQHWVNSILTYCNLVYIGIPQIIFVATHFDKVLQEDVEEKRRTLYTGIEDLFKDHEGRNHLILQHRLFVNTLDKDDPEIQILKKVITDLTFAHPCWGEKTPNAWVPLELEIAQLVADGKQILSLEEIEDLNSDSEVFVLSQEDLKIFLQIQHSLGKIVYFDTPKLKYYVIISPIFMVEVMRSFITDQQFWPPDKKDTFREMSERGLICKEDLFSLWEQKQFNKILPYKEYIFNMLIHLDILSEQRRYDLKSGSRLPVHNYFVPCMVTDRNNSTYMIKECTPQRAIALSFVFKGAIIPPALPNRLISACLSMWNLNKYNGEKLIFSGFVGLSFDKSHDIVICVENNRILLYIVHRSSKDLIVGDIATCVKQCVHLSLERISEFYRISVHRKSIEHNLPFHIEFSCNDFKCFVREETALQNKDWVCECKQRHGKETWNIWYQDETKEQCEEGCPGLTSNALEQIPSDYDLLKFAAQFDTSVMQKLAMHLGITLREWDIMRENHPESIEIAIFKILVKWREKFSGDFKGLQKALMDIDVTTHTLCQVRRVKIFKSDIKEEVLGLTPTDEILDALALEIGIVAFQLGVQLGLSVPTMEIIQYNNKRDLVAQNREILYKWRNDHTIKATLGVLAQGLVNVGRGFRCLERIIDTLGVKDHSLTLRGSNTLQALSAVDEINFRTCETASSRKQSGAYRRVGFIDPVSNEKNTE